MNSEATRKLQGTTLTRLATFDEGNVDVKARTVSLAFSSEYAEGHRIFGIEVLGHAPGEADLTRINNGGALLLDHDAGKQIGVVVSARIDSDRTGRAVVRFGKSALANEIFQDVVDGIRKHVSVGYRITDAELVGERDGVDVVRVTRWQPYEISIVPIPFDPSVGVGRSATTNTAGTLAELTREYKAPLGNSTDMTAPNQLIESLDRALGGATTPARSLGLSALFAQARNAMGFDAHCPPGFDEPTHIRAKVPAVVGSIRLSDSAPVPSADQLRTMDRASTNQTAGVVQTIRSAVGNASRVMQAGAILIPISDAPAPVQNSSGVVAWYKRPSRLEIVTAPAFAAVADDADVTTSPLPVAAADIELGEAANHAISFAITRAEQKQRSDDDMEFIVARALALGLARVVDSVVLGAIVGASPAAFTIAKAATRGLKAGELSAIAGTSGTGAAFGADGSFRVNGVKAEMSDVVAPSVVGAFGRVGIAINDEIRVIVKRTSIRGDMEITCFVTVEALMPTGVNDLWLAAA